MEKHSLEQFSRLRIRSANSQRRQLSHHISFGFDGETCLFLDRGEYIYWFEWVAASPTVIDWTSVCRDQVVKVS